MLIGISGLNNNDSKLEVFNSEFVIKNETIIDTINDLNENGYTPLEVAIKSGSIDLIEQLLKNGADPNLKTDHELPIFHVIKYNYYKALSLLIQYNANLNVRNKNNMTPIHLSISLGFQDIALLLIRSNKIDLSLTIPPNDFSNLILASKNGLYLVVKYLLEHGAKVNYATKYGDTALMYAAAGGYIDIMDILIKYSANVNKHNNMLTTPLMFAVSRNKTEAVRLLIKSGADLQMQDNIKRTALDIAFSRNYQSIVDLIYEFDNSMTDL